MNYVKIIFQHITVEMNASAMTPDHADRIFSTAIDKVNFQFVKIGYKLEWKKQCLSYDKNTFMISIVSLESVSFKYCFWRSTQFIQHSSKTFYFYAGRLSSKLWFYSLGLFNFSRNNASSKSVTISYFSQSPYITVGILGLTSISLLFWEVGLKQKLFS